MTFSDITRPAARPGTCRPRLARTRLLPLALVAPLLGSVPTTTAGAEAPGAGFVRYGEPTTVARTVRLRPEPGSVVRSATVRLPRGDVRARLRTSSYAMFAVTWIGKAPRMAFRAGKGGTWSPWRRARPLEDRPTRGSVEAHGRLGTDLVWVNDADRLRLRITRTRHRQVQVLLIDPGERAADLRPRPKRPGGGQQAPAGTARELDRAPAPLLYSRRQWGADESWRNGGPYYNPVLRQVHVHHTVTVNGYAAADVPALIRGMYRYHTGTLGWTDLGYNFVIDRFGRAWIGRYGGPARKVRGAHTLGFNHSSTGIAMLGMFEAGGPSRKARTALVRLAAWKLDKHERRPAGTIVVQSEGSDLYRSGTRVRLPVIDGHRDTNSTACPGQNLYDALPRIRARAQRRTDRF